MSSLPTQSSHPLDGPARAIDVLAAQWVVRRRAGLDANGEAELAAWLGADPAHGAAWQRMTAMADAVQRARANGAGDAIIGQLKVRERRRRVRRRAAVAGLAAALAIGVGVWLNSPWRAPRPEPSRVAQSAAAIRRLPDGSILELNGGARIAVKFEPARRLVELEAGEALFHVEKDSARPFVVRVAGVDVRAVGTAFSVKLEGAAVEVLVTEGRVGVEEETGGPSLLPVASADAAAVLVAGQRLRVEPPPVSGAPRQVLVTAVGAAEMKERLAWRIPRFEFEGIELADAAARLNQLNRRQITLEGAGVGHLRISGTFYPDDPNTFARLTAASLGLLVEERNEHEIVLRSK